MDSERFDGLVRSFGQARSRRQTLRGLAGAGALVALLVAKSVAAGKAAKPNAPNNLGKSQPGNNQPGTGQNGQLGSGQNGSPGLSPDCEDQCQERYEGCLEPCDMNPASEEFCVNRCETQRINCETRCPPA